MNPTARRWLRLGAFAVFGVAALIAWLLAGMFVLFSFIVVPQPGQEISLRVLQVLLVIGWVAIACWLVVDLGGGNPRFVLAPFAAWIWVFLLLVFIGNISSLGFGP